MIDEDLLIEIQAKEYRELLSYRDKLDQIRKLIKLDDDVRQTE